MTMVCCAWSCCSGVRLHTSSTPALIPPCPSSASSPLLRRSSSILPVNVRIARLDLNAKHGNKEGIQRLAPMCLISVDAKAKGEPMKVMIAGAPASGKGTQCELIVNKYGLVHISIGDLLRGEVASGTENGKRAKVYMEKGILVPDEIVIMMLKERLAQQDVQEKGWLLDGFPQSSSQAKALEDLGIRPNLFIILEVPEEVLVERAIGRRLDPITRKIYHLKYSPPETQEIAARLTQLFDDTETKVKSRLQTHKQNVEAVLSVYRDVMKKVNGNHPKEQVFQQIDSVLARVHEELKKPRDIVLPHTESGSLNDHRFTKKNNWKGIPTKLNNVPHSRDIRQYFYEDVLGATARAVEDGVNRLKVEINIPELNPDMDVYRIGTLMELVRVLALSFADDGKRIKVCVQGSMGEGMLSGMPLQLAGTRRILEFMDWGDKDVMGTFINIGSIGAREVTDQDDIFILVAPQNTVGNCIIDDLQAMVEVANSRPMILVNPRLKDMPSSSGVMQTIGRDKRLEFVASFSNSYYFRLLYKTGTQYPIMGALRMSYPYPYELYKRIDTELGKEKYVELAKFSKKPSSDEINDAFDGKTRAKQSPPTGIWGLLSSIF